jgi:PRC-barrel domain
METTAHPAANSTADGLCYLSARHVAMPGGTLDGLELCNSEHESVGTVEGVLIDPPERRVRYFVVKLSPSDHVLLPVDEIVHVDSETDVPHLEAAPDARLLQFDPRTVRPFSADDAVTSIFARSTSNAA